MIRKLWILAAATLTFALTQRPAIAQYGPPTSGSSAAQEQSAVRSSGPRPLADQAAPTPAPVTQPVTQQRAQQLLTAIPLLFEKNQGQADPKAGFIAHTSDYTLFLTGNDATIVHAPTAKHGAASALRMEWLNASPGPSVEGEGQIAARSNYLIGQDASKWHSSIPNYQRVKYDDLYPGIGLVYFGNHNQLEYDLTVAPGADPNLIRLRIDGAKNLRLDKATGDLLVRDRIGSEMRLRAPVIYQGSPDRRSQQAVAGHYVLSARNTVSFAIGNYDHTQPLVIDPYVAYSTVFGGSVSGGGFASNLLYGMAVDNSGNVYLEGLTSFTNLPTTSGAFQPACNSFSSTQCSNFFVAKFNPNLSGAASLIYATYLGGTESRIGGGQQNAIYTQANALAVDASGDAYLTGYSSTHNYPTTSNAYSTSCGWNGSTSCYGGVLSKLNPTGTALLYSTYFPTSTAGGNLSVTQPLLIAVDASQIAYIAGTAGYEMPTTDGSANTGGSSNVPFIAAFNTTLSGTGSLVYSEYLSVNGPINGLAADSSGNAYLVASFWPAENPASGVTSKTITLNGFQTTTGNSAGIGPVMLRLNNSGTITYASYVGSSNTSPGELFLTAISADASGNAYVGGEIATPAPIMNGLTADSGITAGAYIAKVNTNVTGTASLLYSTFVTANANNGSQITAIANNGSGLVGFVGDEFSTSANISTIEVNPLTESVTSPSGVNIAFAGIIDTTKTGNSALTFLSYIQGVAGNGQLTGVSFDPSNANNLIVGGMADIGAVADPFLSVPASFATTEGNTNNPPFFYKISLLSPSFLTISPSSLTFTNQVLTTTSASQPVTVTNTGTTAVTFTSIVATSQFGGTNNCGTSLAASAFCTVNVTFTPTATGTQTGTLTLTDSDGSSPQTVSLSGAGIAGTPQAVLTPTTVPFNSQTVNTTSNTQVVVLSNPGTATLTSIAVSIAGTNLTDFADTSACGTTLAAGSSCNISVTFTPASATSFSAQLSVADSASGSPQSVVITGTGIAATPQATLSGPVTFVSTNVGSSAPTQVISLTNPGNATLTITSIAITGANASSFSTTTCGSTLAASATCLITISFTPTASGPLSATLTVTDNATAGSTQTAALNGTGAATLAPQATLSPTSLSFPSTTVGVAATSLPITLSNPGTAALAISNILVGGANASSFGQTNTCSASLAAGASCTITVSFTPASAGSLAASISVADNATSSPQTVAITGTGATVLVPQATLSPSPLNFPGTTAVGSSATALPMTLTNGGTAALTISGISVTGANASSFSQTNNCGTSVAAGSFCTINVTFTPTSAAALTAAISVADNATGSQQSAAITGTGAAVVTGGATFTVSSSTPTASVQPGGVAQFNLVIAPVGGSYTNVVTLSATGLPAGATASFLPSAVTPGSAGAPSVLSIQTSTGLASLTLPQPQRQSHVPLMALLAGLPLLGLAAGGRRLRRSSQRWMLLGLAVLALLPALALSGCGGGYFGPAPQMYTVTVVGTSGSLQESTTLSLTVQ